MGMSFGGKLEPSTLYTTTDRKRFFVHAIEQGRAQVEIADRLTEHGELLFSGRTEEITGRELRRRIGINATACGLFMGKLEAGRVYRNARGTRVQIERITDHGVYFYSVTKGGTTQTCGGKAMHLESDFQVRKRIARGVVAGCMDGACHRLASQVVGTKHYCMEHLAENWRHCHAQVD